MSTCKAVTAVHSVFPVTVHCFRVLGRLACQVVHTCH